MLRSVLILLFIVSSLCSFSQKNPYERFLSDSVLLHASVSIYAADASTNRIVLDYNSEKSLTPASVMKLITSAVALELLGPEYTFKTVIGYTGTLNERTGKLNGNIIIKGGGDPALGSPYFEDYYRGFIDKWVSEILKTGIKKIEGRVITDDSWYDYQPVPAKWLWEDAGNYYGAGAYGLSVFDNSYEIRFKEDEEKKPVIKEIIPSECRIDLINMLGASGTNDSGYVFAAPYSNSGWLSGSIPADFENFVLKASITDPPLLMAKMMDKKLKDSGITLSANHTTFRLSQTAASGNFVRVAETVSPQLSEIIEVLNHESVNLYAEHLVKELGKKFKNSGSTDAGIDVIKDFLSDKGIKADGMFIVDGSGLSPANSINAKGLVSLLAYMKNKGQYFPDYINSLPDAGKEGTLKNYFTDPVFDSNLRAKSGSMTRVRSYAGYFTTISGKQIIFCILINNYSGSSKVIVTRIEGILKEIIQDM